MYERQLRSVAKSLGKPVRDALKADAKAVVVPMFHAASTTSVEQVKEAVMQSPRDGEDGAKQKALAKLDPLIRQKWVTEMLDPVFK